MIEETEGEVESVYGDATTKDEKTVGEGYSSIFPLTAW